MTINANSSKTIFITLIKPAVCQSTLRTKARHYPNAYTYVNIYNININIS